MKNDLDLMLCCLFLSESNTFLLHPYISNLDIKVKIYTFPNQSSKNLLKKKKAQTMPYCFSHSFER